MCGNSSISLPFTIPKYKTYPLNTAINGILEAVNDDKIWLYNNYISLWIYANKYVKGYMGDFKYDMNPEYYEQCPMLKNEIIELYKTDNIIEIIKDSISAKKYIFTEVDTYYIDSWWLESETKIHSSHEILVMGYEDEKKVVLVADFFKHIYSIKEIPYLDFRMAFDANMGYIRERDKVESVNILSFQYLNNKNYSFDLVRIRNMISDFLNSKEDTINDESNLFTECEKVVYGIECLDRIIEYLEQCVNEGDRLDYKTIHLIYIFNDVMSARIKYMIENQYILNGEKIQEIQKEFDKLVHKSIILRNLFMKYNVKKERKYGETIIEKVKVMFEQLQSNLKELSDYFDNNC